MHNLKDESIVDTDLYSKALSDIREDDVVNVETDENESKKEPQQYNMRNLDTPSQEEEKHETRFDKIKKQKIKNFNKRFDNKRISHFIPCLYMPYAMGSSKLMIYFHANAEDVVLSNELLDYVRAFLRVNILAIEYPGYGLYTDDHQ